MPAVRLFIACGKLSLLRRRLARGLFLCLCRHLPAVCDVYCLCPESGLSTITKNKL